MAKKIKRSKGTGGHFKKTRKVSLPHSSSSLQSVLQQAKSHHQAGRFQQAETLYRQILASEPDNPEALNLLGLLAHQVGRNEVAVELIQKAISCRPDYIEAFNNLGNAFLAQGHLEKAATSYRQAILLQPDFVDAHYNLGITFNYQGKLDEAIASYRRVLTFAPDFAEAHYNLGIVLQTQGKANEAVISYRQALTLEPENIDALFNLGVIFNAQGNLDAAVSSYRKVLALKPDFAEAYNNLGIALQAKGETDEALACFKQALKLKPDYAEAHYNLGVVLQVQGRTNEAVASFRQALALNPDYAEAQYKLGIALYTQNNLEEAIASYLRAINLKLDNAEVHYNLGLALMDQGKLEEAIASYRQALSLKPDFAEAHHNLGIIFSELGETDNAIACQRKALSFKPGYAMAYKSLTTAMKFTELDDVIQAMEDLYSKRNELSDADRIALGYALGKAFEDLGNYDKSFNFILEVNRLQRGLYKYSPEADQTFFERIKETFSSDFFASHKGVGNQDRSPIFILGMPRSGTTLIEQILASHPLVFGAGELEYLTHLTTVDVCPDRTATQFPECILDLDMIAFERMGADYIKKIRKYSKDTKYITDKMPHNFLYVGLIKAILPYAKVIHCMRNPMDNCFSLFKKTFKKRHDYAHDMIELGQYYNLYRDLMDHWERVLPGFMYPLKYEEMVSDQQNQTKLLLDFCGLPWDDACLTFYKTERRVVTASLAQVRQPIYKDSVERWKRYEKQLEPLRKTIYG